MISLLISSIFTWDTNPILGIDKLVGDSLITLFCLLVIQIIGISKTAGFTKKGFIKGIVLGIPFIIIGISAAIVGNLGVDFQSLSLINPWIIGTFTLNMFLVGVNEEVMLRSLILNNMISTWGNNQKGIIKSVLVSALIFGAIHLPNIFFVPPITVLVQAINAASAGVLFAAIYIRSKNIWAGIVIHTLVDWLALFIGLCFTGGSSVIAVEMNIFQGLVMIFAGSLPPLLIGFFLLRRSKNNPEVQ